MSSTDGRRPSDGVTATQHLRTALMVSLMSLGCAIAGQSPAILMFGLPFILYVVWALLQRPRTSEPLTASPSGRVIANDLAQVRFTYAAAPGRLVTAVITGQDRARFGPARGARSDLGTVTVTASPFRWGQTFLGEGIVRTFDTSLAWRQNYTVSDVAVQVSPGVSSMRGPTGIVHPLGISGPHLSRQMGEGTDLADIRPYRPGDRRRSINWRVSARTKDLHVNTAHVERDADVCLIVDTTVNARGSVEDATSLDLTAGAVASLAQYYLNLGDRVAMFDVGGQLPSIPYGSGQRQLRRVLHAFATMDQNGSSEEVRRYPDSRAGQLVFLCSPLLEPRVLGEISRLRDAGLQVVVVDTLPTELGLHSNEWIQEAWMLRRLMRRRSLEHLESLGVPAVAWHGPTSLAGVLMALERTRRAPRMSRRRA